MLSHSRASCPFDTASTESYAEAWAAVKDMEYQGPRTAIDPEFGGRLQSACEDMHRLADTAKEILQAERPGVMPKSWTQPELRLLSMRMREAGYHDEAELIAAYAEARVVVSGLLDAASRRGPARPPRRKGGKKNRRGKRA